MTLKRLWALYRQQVHDHAFRTVIETTIEDRGPYGLRSVRRVLRECRGCGKVEAVAS